MNRRQKAVLINFIIVVIVTAATVIGMVNFKDWVNRTESMRAMEALSKTILQYHNLHGSVPSKSYVDRIIETLPGYARIGNINYRARWIEFDCSGDEILAYSEKIYNASIFGTGFVVLRLDGSVEWMKSRDFKALLAEQQSLLERQLSEK